MSLALFLDMNDKRNIVIMAILVVLLLIAITPWYAFGQTGYRCEDIFRPVPYVYNILDRDDKITEDQISEIKDVIDKTAMMVQPHFRLPREVKLHLEAEGTMAAGGLDRVAVPFKYGPKSPRHTHAVIAHEFGHVIWSTTPNSAVAQLLMNLKYHYENKLRDVKDHLPAIKSELQNQKVEHAKLRRAQIEFRQANEDVPSPELHAKIVEVGQYIKALEAKIPVEYTLDRLNEFRFAYEELFADVVSVAMLQNPRAISSVMFPLVKNKNEADNRNFLTPKEVHGWNNDQIHQVFSPTRYALSQNPIAVRLFTENPGRLVRIVYDAMIQDMADLAPNVEKLYTITPEERNLRLIRNITLLLEKESVNSSSTTSRDAR